jgi:hypothetical protein
MVVQEFQQVAEALQLVEVQLQYRQQLVQVAQA